MAGYIHDFLCGPLYHTGPQLIPRDVIHRYAGIETLAPKAHSPKPHKDPQHFNMINTFHQIWARQFSSRSGKVMMTMEDYK